MSQFPQYFRINVLILSPLYQNMNSGATRNALFGPIFQSCLPLVSKNEKGLGLTDKLVHMCLYWRESRIHLLR